MFLPVIVILTFTNFGAANIVEKKYRLLFRIKRYRFKKSLILVHLPTLHIIIMKIFLPV